jgi:asparagine synthase (glutamine-hydrolysing)
MISDVEVGAFLSGGVDSSTLLALMAEFSDHPVKAFTIGFEDQRVYDESRHAERAAGRFGAEFHHTVFTPAHVEEVVRDLIRHIEEPIGDPACLPTLYLSREASKQVKVVLTGEGADELFAGYGYYKRLPPRRPEGGKNFGRHGIRKWMAWLSGQAGGGQVHISGRFRAKSRLSGYPYAMTPAFVDLLVRDLPAQDLGGIGDLISDLEQTWLPQSPDASRLSRALHVDIHGWLPEDLLMNDRTTMTHSLEARVPFLDYRVVELAMSMPPDVKIRGGEGKVVVREAFRDLIGADLADRKKHGFNLPMNQWVKKELRPLLDESLGPDALTDTPWLNGGAVTALFGAHDADRGGFDRQIWTIFILVEWFRQLEAARLAAV